MSVYSTVKTTSVLILFCLFMTFEARAADPKDVQKPVSAPSQKTSTSHKASASAKQKSVVKLTPALGKSESKKALDAIADRFSEIEQQLTDMTQKNQKLEAEIKSKDLRIKELASLAADNVKVSLENQKLRETGAKRVAALEVEVKSKDVRIKELSSLVDSYTKAGIENKREQENFKKRVASLESDVETKTLRIKELGQLLANNDKKILEARKREDADARRLTGLEADVKTKGLRIKEQEAALGKVSVANQGLNKQIAELQNEKNSLKQQNITTAKEARESFSKLQADRDAQIASLLSSAEYAMGSTVFASIETVSLSGVGQVPMARVDGQNVFLFNHEQLDKFKKDAEKGGGFKTYGVKNGKTVVAVSADDFEEKGGKWKSAPD